MAVAICMIWMYWAARVNRNIIVRAEILLVLAHVAAAICGQNERRKPGRCAESVLLISMRDALSYLPGISFFSASPQGSCDRVHTAVLLPLFGYHPLQLAAMASVPVKAQCLS